MRKLLLTTAALAALTIAPSVANAQGGTFTGAAVGAGTGLLVAGPVGFLVGGVIGAGVGANADARVGYRDPYWGPAPYGPRCWRDEWNRRVCR
jgi:osmotically inducible lipoprotein OsmB